MGRGEGWGVQLRHRAEALGTAAQNVRAALPWLQSTPHGTEPPPGLPFHPSRYDDGLCHAVGVGHSGAVTGLQVSPDGSRVVSVGAEGGIFVWNYRRPPLLPEAGA